MQGWDRAWEVAVLACRYGDIKLSKGGADDEAKALRVKVFRRDFFFKKILLEKQRGHKCTTPVQIYPGLLRSTLALRDC